MKKVMLVVFNGELMCFTHVMLYAKELNEKGYEVGVILEGAATKLPAQLVVPDAPFANLFTYLMENNLIESVCKACSVKMGAFEDVQKIGLPVNGDLNGHPSLEKYIAGEYQIITF